jgi:hypothetical protein
VHSSRKDEDDDDSADDDDDDGSVVVPTVVRVQHMSAGLGGAGTPSPTPALARPWSKGAPEGHPGMTRVVGEGGTAAVDVRRTPVRLPRVEPVQGVAAPGGSEGVVSRYGRWPSVGTSPVRARTGASGASVGGGKQTSILVGVHVCVRVRVCGCWCGCGCPCVRLLVCSTGYHATLTTSPTLFVVHSLAGTKARQCGCITWDRGP